MSEQLKYVSPEYQKQLEDLADTLCTPERFGRTAVAEVVQLPKRQEVPDDVA